MKWEKKGLIYSPTGDSWWSKHSALTPTPILINKDVIRIYAGFRDDEGVSRIGYVDVEAQNPSNIIKISEEPVLDIGEPGTFDDNGVILGDVLKVGADIYMYYVGFQIVKKSKFLAFSGLAISSDDGETFRRVRSVPVLDRGHDERYIAAIHSVHYEDGVFKVWYAAGDGWEMINGTPFPKYRIKYIESSDGIDFCATRKRSFVCVDVQGDEYRIGRPRVYKVGNMYKMFYTRGTTKGDYIAGYAESLDGVKWERKDSKIGIYLSESGWDSKALSYPSLLEWSDKVYMFYNGNDMGRDGFGYAELVSWE
ncbi:hypothetical protein [Anoxybacillus sp. TBDG-1]